MEYWDIYDKDRNLTGRIHPRGDVTIPLPEGDYHLVVNAFIVNSEGKLLISKRHQDKHFPLFWEVPSGSALAGEASLEGAIREAMEEVGVDLSSAPNKLFRSTVRGDTHRDNWLFYHDADIGNLVLQPEEVIDAKWATLEEIEALMASGQWVPHMIEYREIFAEQRE